MCERTRRRLRLQEDLGIDVELASAWLGFGVMLTILGASCEGSNFCFQQKNKKKNLLAADTPTPHSNPRESTGAEILKVTDYFPPWGKVAKRGRLKKLALSEVVAEIKGRDAFLAAEMPSPSGELEAWAAHTPRLFMPGSGCEDRKTNSRQNMQK